MNQELINQVNQYLKGNSSYTAGCSLFFSLTTNKQFALRLMRSDSEVNQATLRYQLEKISEAYSVDPSLEQEPSPPTPPKTIFQVENTTAEPIGVELKMRDEWKALYRRRGHLHGRLHEAQTEQSRHEIAREIVSVQKQIDSLNLELENLKGGAIPLRFLEKTISAEAYKKIQNLKAYIRRDKFSLTGDVTTSERKKLLENIAKYEQKIKQLS